MRDIYVEWPDKLVSGRLLKRYKRFLADVVLDNGEEITVHCPNTGAMTGCAVTNSKVYLLNSHNPKRKYAYTWELVESESGKLICVHSARANSLVAEALTKDIIAPLSEYKHIQREKTVASGSRIDFLLSSDSPDIADCYVEVKSVTLHCGDGEGAFPDTVSTRAARHIEELVSLKRQGFRVVLLFAVLHEDIDSVRPAVEIDPLYARSLISAVDDGLEVYAYKARIGEDGISLAESIPVILSVA